MADESTEQNTQPNKNVSGRQKKHLPEVLTVRDWKEYLGESILIIFSVVLALGLTEYFTNLHEKQQTREILHLLKEELVSNKNDAASQYAYHLQVFKNIDSAKHNPVFAKQFLDSGLLHLNIIMPKGALLHDLNDVAWQEAKQNNIFAHIDFETYRLLADAYDNQERVLNLEPSLARVLVSYESRKPENIQITLTLVHDILFAWVVERTPLLLKKYQWAIDKLADY